MNETVLDTFEDVSGWLPVASGQAQLHLSREDGPAGPALRLDFDFQGGGGFVVARKAFSLSLPESYALELDLRGRAPRNKLEIKLSDPSGRNVWWYHRDEFDFSEDGDRLRVRSSEIEFAWGPAGGGTLGRLGSIELVIAAGPGGKGTVWLEGLRLFDESFQGEVIASASGWLEGHGPERLVDGLAETRWCSASAAAPQWCQLDFQRPREYGGLIIHWLPGHGALAFEVQLSDDGETWVTAYAAPRAGALRSYIPLPRARSRMLRLALLEPQHPNHYAIVEIDVQPFEFSRSQTIFFDHLAAVERRGLYPKYFTRRQTYSTPIGLAEGRTGAGASSSALLNEEGMVEVDKGSFSIEPFLFVDGRLTTWADVEIHQELEDGFLPHPSSVWQGDGLSLGISSCAVAAALPAIYLRYRLENQRHTRLRGRLFLAVRPFQVTPPWQAHGNLGGLCPIGEIDHRDGVAWVNGDRAIRPLTAGSHFGAAGFDEGGILELLADGQLPPRGTTEDVHGLASAAFGFGLDLAAGEHATIGLVVPLGPCKPDEVGAADAFAGDVETAFAAASEQWRRRLTSIELDLPVHPSVVSTLRTAIGHILINRDGAAVQPGPRRYQRSWIRDAATMCAALLRAGCRDEVRDFLRWYAPYQAADGNVPCCVDRSGADWLVEHDSHGQLIFTIAEYFRLAGDRELLAELWPHARRAADYIGHLRAGRMTDEYRAPDKLARFGLLPESASHEGYLAHPVHSYYDDFWALRGLADAAMLAEEIGDCDSQARFLAARDELHRDLYDSIERTIAERKLPYIPGSVEWADFDPNATTTAITTTDAAQSLPATELAYTYDEYLRGFQRRRDGEVDWSNYTAYEIRIIGALTRLGRRRAAHELLQYFLDDRRPSAWNQWPEISWRDPASPGHIGDVPHTWIAAEYVMAVLGLFGFERSTDQSLVIAAGIADSWLAAGPVAIGNLPTYYGRLGFRLRKAGDRELHLVIEGVTPPPGGIVVEPPLPQPLRSVHVNGVAHRDFDAFSLRVRVCPAEIVMRF